MAEKRYPSWFYPTEHQTEFVNKFMNAGSAQNHLLFAPVGSGKSATSFALITEMINSGAKRILVLIPALALVDQYKSILNEIKEDANVVALNRKVIRAIETLNQKDSFWERVLAIATFQQAANDEIRESIFSVRWDLIVIDEIDSVIAGGKYADLIKKLVEQNISKRILVFSSQAPTMSFRANKSSFLNNKLFDGFEITRWRRKDIFWGRRMREITFNVIAYERTKEEIDFIKKYSSLSKWLLDKKFQNKIRSKLVSSSLYAAEESLRTFRNRLVHGELSELISIDETEKEFVKDEELLGDTNAVRVDRKFSNKDFPKLMNDLSLTLDLLEKIQSDSKINALLNAIEHTRGKEQRTWIYASYQSTISYLYSSLGEMTQNLYQISAQSPTHLEFDTIQRFRNEGGILIASTSRLTGINLPLDNLILYDIPESEKVIYTIFTRLSNPTQEKTNEPVNIFVFDEGSNAIKAEQVRLQNLQKSLRQLIDEEM